jgi:hypothetical protein
VDVLLLSAGSHLGPRLWVTLTTSTDPHTLRHIIITISSNETGHSLADLLPEDKKMDSMYFIQNIVDPLAEFCSSNSRQAHQAKFTFHFDDAPIYETKSFLDPLEGCGFSRMDHSVYGPD